jgi:hypothetical protein
MQNNVHSAQPFLSDLLTFTLFLPFGKQKNGNDFWGRTFSRNKKRAGF